MSAVFPCVRSILQSERDILHVERHDAIAIMLNASLFAERRLLAQ